MSSIAQLGDMISRKLDEYDARFSPPSMATLIEVLPSLPLTVVSVIKTEDHQPKVPPFLFRTSMVDSSPVVTTKSEVHNLIDTSKSDNEILLSNAHQMFYKMSASILHSNVDEIVAETVRVNINVLSDVTSISDSRAELILHQTDGVVVFLTQFEATKRKILLLNPTLLVFMVKLVRMYDSHSSWEVFPYLISSQSPPPAPAPNISSIDFIGVKRRAQRLIGATVQFEVVASWIAEVRAHSETNVSILVIIDTYNLTLAFFNHKLVVSLSRIVREGFFEDLQLMVQLYNEFDSLKCKAQLIERYKHLKELFLLAARMSIAETAPSHIRGQFVALRGFFMVIGMVTGYTIGSLLVNILAGWCNMYGANFLLFETSSSYSALHPTTPSPNVLFPSLLGSVTSASKSPPHVDDIPMAPVVPTDCILPCIHSDVPIPTSPMFVD